MKIAYIGKFNRLYDEEYIAQAFEELGHKVQRIHETYLLHEYKEIISRFKPDFVLCTKLYIAEPLKLLAWLKERGIPSVSWTFDLYWDYVREDMIHRVPGFKCDRVFTSDGGHDEKWKDAGIRHDTLRQGINKYECHLSQGRPEDKIVFIGSKNIEYPPRQEMVKFLEDNYPEKFQWLGKVNTHEIRGLALNELYATTKIVVGDSVYSDNYWSNRVVETLGRGGFLIHQYVPGIEKEYPYLVTYEKGNLADLKAKIDYYLTHEDERRELVLKNHEWVKEHYTMDKKCGILISKLK